MPEDDYAHNHGDNWNAINASDPNIPYIAANGPRDEYLELDMA
jgi:uncharacterized Rossmann fold enzyme